MREGAGAGCRRRHPVLKNRKILPFSPSAKQVDVPAFCTLFGLLASVLGLAACERKRLGILIVSGLSNLVATTYDLPCFVL